MREENKSLMMKQNEIKSELKPTQLYTLKEARKFLRGCTRRVKLTNYEFKDEVQL